MKKTKTTIHLYDDGSYNVTKQTNPSYGYVKYVDRFVEKRDRYAAERKPFLWLTDRDTLVAPSDMATPHLINAVNMIWRNVFGIKNDRPEIMEEWASIYVDCAAKELTQELQHRVEDA